MELSSHNAEILVNQELLEEIAAVTNKGCPLRMDQITMLDSLAAKSGGKLHYYYSVSTTKAEIDKMISVDAFNRNMKVQLAALLNAGTTDAESLKKTNATFVHEYYDKNKDLYTKIVIKPSDYK